MDNEKLLSSIKQLCKDKNITITKLEEELEFSQGLISRWAKNTPSLDKIVDIADYFDVSLDEVVGRDNKFTIKSSKFISTLKTMTDTNEIVWEKCSSDDLIILFPDKKIDEIFYIVEDYYDIYRARYKNSFVYIVADYDLHFGNINSLTCTSYIQPDLDSIPVMQQDEECDDLWLLIRKKILGTPDEYKAEQVKQQMMDYTYDIEEYSEEQIEKITNNLTQMDPKIKEVLLKMQTPEFQALQKAFTSEEFRRASELVSRLSKYYYINKK